MRIAFTSDLHLTSHARHPERFQALANILQQCDEQKIQLLIIAGDLFDRSLPNYADFEKAYQSNCPQGLATIILPGNHDSQLHSSHLALEGIDVPRDPSLLPLDNGRSLLLVPYQDQCTLGEQIAPFSAKLEPRSWILVGHGDWTAGRIAPDPNEPGVYMPLTRKDLQLYQPDRVILGHIHKPMEEERVFIPGSPCPITAAETGKRRFLILDTSSGNLASHIVRSAILFFQEDFILLPQEKQLERFKEVITQRIANWNLSEDHQPSISLQVSVSGFSPDRRKVFNTIKEEFSAYEFSDPSGPDLTRLYHQFDPDHAHVAQQVAAWIDRLEWSGDPLEPSREEILAEALKIILGVEE